MAKTQLAIHHEADAQSIAIPACALAQQTYAACGAGCFRPGVGHKPNDIAEPAEPQGVFHILSRADVEPALLRENIPAIHGTGAGQTRDRIHHVWDRPPRGDRHQVFDALKSCPYRVALVADRDAATCAGDERIAERSREALNRVRFEDSVGIYGQEKIAAGKPCCSVDGGAAAAARPMADDHVNLPLRSRPLRDRTCFVGGAVVDDDDFDRSEGLPAQRTDRRSKPGAAVERRDNHAYPRLANGPTGASPLRAEQSKRHL